MTLCFKFFGGVSAAALSATELARPLNLQSLESHWEGSLALQQGTVSPASRFTLNWQAT